MDERATCPLFLKTLPPRSFDLLSPVALTIAVILAYVIGSPYFWDKDYALVTAMLFIWLIESLYFCKLAKDFFLINHVGQLPIEKGSWLFL